MEITFVTYYCERLDKKAVKPTKDAEIYLIEGMQTQTGSPIYLPKMFVEGSPDWSIVEPTWMDEVQADVLRGVDVKSSILAHMPKQEVGEIIEQKDASI